jgi:hypothetical protein
MYDLVAQAMKRIDNDIKHHVSTETYPIVYNKIEEVIQELIKSIEQKNASDTINLSANQEAIDALTQLERMLSKEPESEELFH